MKKLALLALGMLMATATCYADAKVDVNCADCQYVQKYVMDNFRAQYPEFTLESRTADKVVYFEKKALVEKKSQVVGQTRHEVIFTTEQNGEQTILGIIQNNINKYRDGKEETTKPSDDLDDLLFLNSYRSFFNDSYSFCFAPQAKAGKEGVAIANVFSYGPMHDAGIQNGAVVIAVDGVKVVDHAKEFVNNVIPDQFKSDPVTFTIKYKDATKDYTLTPVAHESKYTKIKEARAKAAQERKEGKRGIESWLKL